MSCGSSLLLGPGQLPHSYSSAGFPDSLSGLGGQAAPVTVCFPTIPALPPAPLSPVLSAKPACLFLPQPPGLREDKAWVPVRLSYLGPLCLEEKETPLQIASVVSCLTVPRSYEGLGHWHRRLRLHIFCPLGAVHSPGLAYPGCGQERERGSPSLPFPEHPAPSAIPWFTQPNLIWPPVPAPPASACLP